MAKTLDENVESDIAMYTGYSKRAVYRLYDGYIIENKPACTFDSFLFIRMCEYRWRKSICGKNKQLRWGLSNVLVI